MLGLWANGIAVIANNTEGYNDSESHVIEGNYSVSIDLSDLQSNLGKDLYNDGTHRISVSYIDNTGDINSGGYRIGFRARGHYSLTKATLISGVHHVTLGDKSFTSVMSSKMTAEYKGKTYTSPEMGISGLNYRDGDDFSFYIFPADAFKNNQISLSEKGIVHLTVTNLYENIWSKR